MAKTLFSKGGRLKKEDMPCNKPRKSPNPKKKKVVKGCENGKEKIIHFGDASMKDYTQHGSKSRRKSYLARSGGIKGKDSKLSANYWSRKVLWKAKCGGKMDKLRKLSSGGMIDGMLPADFLRKQEDGMNNLSTGIEVASQGAAAIGDMIVPGSGALIQGIGKGVNTAVSLVDNIFNSRKRRAAKQALANRMQTKAQERREQEQKNQLLTYV